MLLVNNANTNKMIKSDLLTRNTRRLLEGTDQLHAKGVTLQIQNLGIDTATPTGKLMLTMIGEIATFERESMLERQAEGIALAKAKGVYREESYRLGKKASNYVSARPRQVQNLYLFTARSQSIKYPPCCSTSKDITRHY